VFRHVLIATDLSEPSERAVDVAAALSRALGARLTVLHVYEVSSTTMAGADAAMAERTWPGAIRARARLDREVDRLRASGLEVEGALRLGLPPEEIVQGALEHDADLIVTGTRGRRGLARLWYGSVAAQVLRSSPISVLTLRGDRRDNVIPLRRSSTSGRPTSAK
jgi:nucleotide-binding universal stress UspA family protein